MNRRLILIAGFWATVLYGCTDAPVNQDAEAEALMELNRQWSAENVVDIWNAAPPPAD